MLGDFPPSSSETFFRLPVAAWTISRPTSVDPVKATLSTPGCAAIAAPAVSPKPVTTLITPSGIPASSDSSPSRSAVSGVCSAGFRTTTQPVARAGATFQEAIERGKFQGMICPATPTGSRRVYAWTASGGPKGMVSPLILVAHPAMYRIMSALLATSPRAATSGLPLSKVSN